MSKEEKTIVVIDDNRYVNVQFQRVLEAMEPNVSLQYFQRASESLLYLHRVQPAVLFVDILMPDSDGFTLISSLRRFRLYDRIPVVMMASTDYLQNRQLAKELGVLEFLQKPTPSNKLRQVIEKYLNMENPYAE